MALSRVCEKSANRTGRSAATAVVLFGIGDGALRPALVRLAAGGNGRAARRWSRVGLALTVLAIGLMTGATYVG